MPTIKEIRSYYNKDAGPNIIRNLSRATAAYWARILLYTSITGNQVSLIMGILAIISSILFAFGSYGYILTGVILLYLQRNLDDVDGLIARYRGSASMRGIYVDLIISTMTGPLTYMGLTLGVFKMTNSIIFLTFGLLATAFSLLAESPPYLKHQGLVMKLIQYSRGEKLDDLKNKSFKESPLTAKKQELWKKYATKSLGFYYSLFLLLPLAIFDLTPWYLVFYGITLPLKWLVLTFYEFKTSYNHLEYLFKPYQPK